MKTVMLCKAGDFKELSNYDRDKWVFQQKLDGTRIIAHKEEKDVNLINRYDRSKNSVFPEIVNELRGLTGSSFVLDGEVVVKGTNGGDFRELAKREHLKDEERINELRESSPCVFMVFDVLEYNGKDLKDLTLVERQEYLKYFKGLDYVSVVENMDLDYLIKETESSDIEGIVGKKVDSSYEFRRSKSWLKFKIVKELEAEVKGFKESDKRGIRSLVFDKEGVERSVGSGLSGDDISLLCDIFSEKCELTKKDDVWYIKSGPTVTITVGYYTDGSLDYRNPKLIQIKVEEK